MSLASAIRSGDVSQLPSRRDEDWRWTDLRGLLRTLPPQPSEGAKPWLWDSPFSNLPDMIVATMDGQGPTDLDLAAGEERVVAWRFMAGTAEVAHASELWVTLAEGAALVLIEFYDHNAASYVRDVAVKIKVGEGAFLNRIVVMDDGDEAISVSHAEVELTPGSIFCQTVLTNGAKRQRVETRIHNPGQGAATRVDGVYVLSNKRHADITTEIVHGGVDGLTSQVIKGVVRDQARGVFQGRIVVAEGADRTEARMGHHALVLSDRAEVDAKPELLIYADDVQCAHGNTVGRLDEDALFYAMQRGMSPETARALLTEAFVGEVVDRIEHDDAREAARAWVAAQLGAS